MQFYPYLKGHFDFFFDLAARFSRAASQRGGHIRHVFFQIIVNVYLQGKH
jgi:hypothetical protein